MKKLLSCGLLLVLAANVTAFAETGSDNYAQTNQALDIFQKIKNVVDDGLDKNKQAAPEKTTQGADQNAQALPKKPAGRLGKYTQASQEEELATTMTKEELFDVLEKQYLESEGVPKFSFSDVKFRGQNVSGERFILGNVLSRSYNVHCESQANVPENYTTVGYVWDAMRTIVRMQHSEASESASHQLAENISFIGSVCGNNQSSQQIKNFLDDFIAESEEWQKVKQERAAEEARIKQEQRKAKQSRAKQEHEATQSSPKPPVTGLDKILQTPADTPVTVMTREEFFETLKQQYLIKSREGRTPYLSLPNIDYRGLSLTGHGVTLGNILSEDYGVHCDPPQRGMPENYDTANGLWGMMGSIIEMQYDNESRNALTRRSLVDRMSGIGSGCKNGKQIKAYLDEFVAEAEKWYQQAKQERTEKEARLKQERADNAKYIDKIREGKAEIRNFNDAWGFYSANGNWQEVLLHPKAQPDNRFYALGGAILDKVEKNGNYIVKFSNSYAVITKTSSAKHNVGFSENLRVGMPFYIIGKYVANGEYTTVIGTTKTMPVFEAFYLSLN
ncbi:MAG: hypothetical protein FWF41_06415 [Betaproteobacteria bacterium]|nr:hypothetical protein [Betaproteobacteria bacterium]